MADEDILKGLIESHLRYTHSVRAKEILDNWDESLGKCVKVFPNEYKKALAGKENA